MQEVEPPGLRSDYKLSDLSMLGLQEVQQVRLILSGGTAVEWRRLAFRDLDHVDQGLRVAGFDMDDPVDMMRLTNVHRRAVDYLERVLACVLSPGVVNPDDVRDLFLLASQPGPAQSDACITLKTMHVIHHVTGRELLYRLPVSTADLFYRVETKVFDAIDRLKSSGVAISEFSGSRKTPSSIITKLLCSPKTHAVQVHDRLRFRIVTETYPDLFRALACLANWLIPFSYVVPGASRNDLIDLRRIIDANPHLGQFADPTGVAIDGDGWGQTIRRNEFSSPDYKVINFVIDMPVRIDDIIHRTPNYRFEDGAVVFLLVEFQLIDRQTKQANAVGSNQHNLYKLRQHQRVKERLGVGAPATTFDES